ncbi:MAG: MFS transporter [Novosphingobium sp.]
MAARLEGSAREEWRSHGTVVLAACAGAAMSATTSYSTSLFFEPLEQEYGWSRVDITSVHLFGSLFALTIGPFVGHALDRFGSRRVGIAAVLCFFAAFSMLALTTSNIWIWRALWVQMALVSMLYQPMVWSSAVASFFTAGRGFALAVTLSGTSLCSVLTPPLTVFLIDKLGWRLALPALAACWTVVVLPLVLLFFFSARDRERGDPQSVQSGPAHPGFFKSFRGEALTWRFLQVAVAAFSIALVVVSTALTIVPILSSNGIARGTAAGIAALLGLSSIAGRLTIGLLLDRFPGRLIAGVAVCMPIAGSLVLLGNPGSVPAAAVAVVIFGLSLGAELDILAYLTSRYFKLASFGLLFALVGGFVSLAGALGPVLLNAVYDATQSYALALWGIIPVCLISAVLFLLLGPYPENAR